jgi:DNA ligase (NAD+)
MAMLAATLQARFSRRTSAVSTKTDFVVVGESPGSKAEKARELGIPVIPGEEFESWLQG